MDTSKVAQKFQCIKCDYTTSRKSSYDKHILSAKHKMDTSNFIQKLHCDKCDYTTSQKSSYVKHILSAKHKMDTSKLQVAQKVATHHHICECGKKYRYSQGLSKHKRGCNYKIVEQPVATEEIVVKDRRLNNEVIIDIIRENQEFRNMLLEQQKENKELMSKMIEIAQTQLPVPSTIINNQNNQTNNFNLNFFLNETCKDAMNIQEFIENIKVTFDELMTIGDSGFVSGVTDILVKRLRDLEVEKRPIHCTDSKRETIYLKDNNSWNKDDKSKTQLKRMIEKIEYKNVAALHNWCGENPDANVNNTPQNLLRDKIYMETLRGDDKTRDKIIKNISKEVTIERE